MTKFKIEVGMKFPSKKYPDDKYWDRHVIYIGQIGSRNNMIAYKKPRGAAGFVAHCSRGQFIRKMNCLNPR